MTWEYQNSIDMHVMAAISGSYALAKKLNLFFLINLL